MCDPKVASLLHTCSEHLSRLLSSPAEGSLSIETEGEGEYARLEYCVQGVSVMRVRVRREAGRMEEVSFEVTESGSSGSDTLSSIACESSFYHQPRPTFSPSRSTPFTHKPSFSRQPQHTKKRRRRPLSLDLAEEEVGVGPEWEDIARYPKPSIGSWGSGTKREYEELYYYRDLGNSE